MAMNEGLIIRDRKTFVEPLGSSQRPETPNCVLCTLQRACAYALGLTDFPKCIKTFFPNFLVNTLCVNICKKMTYIVSAKPT